MKFDLKKKIVAAVVAITLIAGGTIAYAYWTSGGTGTGTASTGTASAVTINQTSVVTAMGPGVAPQALSGTFTVAKPSRVGQVSVSGVTTDKTGCTTADFATTNPTPTNATVTTGSTWSGGSIVFVDNPTRNQDACQNAVVTVAYTSN